MPVDLNAIPPLAPLIRRPQTKRWLTFLGAILLAESASTLWRWESERFGFIFWSTALGFPKAIWELCFSLRRFSYQCDQVWAAAWNINDAGEWVAGATPGDNVDKSQDALL